MMEQRITNEYAGQLRLKMYKPICPVFCETLIKSAARMRTWI